MSRVKRRPLTDTRADNHTAADEAGLSGLTYAFVKSSWCLLALLGFILFSVVIFIGIEGKYTIIRNYQLLSEQEQFNKSWEAPSRRARVTDIPHFDQFYRNAKQIAAVKCEIAKMDLVSWNNKDIVEAIRFSASIVSTEGWGIHYPTSNINRLICLVYAMIGIPLFAVAIGTIMRVLKNLGEYTSKRSKAIRRYYKIFALVALTIFIASLIFYGFTRKQYVKKYYSSTIENVTLSGKLIAAGKPIEWSLTQGIYYVTVNGFFLVGFGDVWPYYTHHPQGEHNHLTEILGVQLQILIIVCVLAVVSWVFEAMSNHFNQSLDHGIVKTYNLRQQMERVHEQNDLSQNKDLMRARRLYNKSNEL